MACGKTKQRAVDVQKDHFLDMSGFLHAFINCNNSLNCKFEHNKYLNIKSFTKY